MMLYQICALKQYPISYLTVHKNFEHTMSSSNNIIIIVDALNPTLSRCTLEMDIIKAN